MATIKLNAIQVTQPIGEFYIGVMDAKDLVAISYSDVRKMKREVEDYLGIQRELKKTREKEIREYINTLDATFPNSIIVAIKGKYVTFEDGQMVLTFDEFEKARCSGQVKLATDFYSSQYLFSDSFGVNPPL